MTTDELARTVSMGVLGTLLAFEFVAAAVSWITARERTRRPPRSALWFSRPFTIRTHLEARRHEFDAVRWQYPVLRSARHGHEIRDAIRGIVRNADRPGTF